MVLWTIKNSIIMGACRSWEGKSIFARAPLLVIKLDSDEILKVSGYPDAEHVQGDELTFEECEGLVVQGEALLFDQVIPLKQAGTVCWILRFDQYQEDEEPRWIFGDLISRDVLLTLPVHGPGRTFACMVDEKKADAIREKWAVLERAYARSSVIDGDYWVGDWAKAAECAERALMIKPKLDPWDAAQVVFYLEKAGNLVRSHGFHQMLKNSNDADFIAEVELCIEHLKKELHRT